MNDNPRSAGLDVPGASIAVPARNQAQADAEFEAFKSAITTQAPNSASRHQYYIDLADAVERGARCLGLAVGAVIVRGERVVGTGYNGTPTGVPNCVEGGCERCRGRDASASGRFYDLCVCVHAEQNAVATAARFAVATDGAVLYTTVQPCFSCFKELMQAGVKEIYFLDWWPGASSAQFDWVLPQYHGLVEAFLDEGEHHFVRLELPADRQQERLDRQQQRRSRMDDLRTRLNGADDTG